jgi:hypothetical protein
MDLFQMQFAMLVFTFSLVLCLTQIFAKIVHQTPLNQKLTVACIAENIKASIK